MEKILFGGYKVGADMVRFSLLLRHPTNGMVGRNVLRAILDHRLV